MRRENLSRMIVGNTTRFLKKNSSIILATFATIGVGLTVYTTAKAVPKAQKKAEDAKNDKGEELTKLEYVKAVGPSYILPVSIAAGTIACICTGTVLSINKEKSLMAAYEMVNGYFQRYRGKLIELHGEEADLEVRDALAREYCDFHIKGLDIPDQKAIWYDELSGQSVVAYEREIMDAEYHLNRNFVMRGYSSLNDFYDFVGMELTEAGECLGWSSSDGYYWIDIEHRRIDTDSSGMPVYSIDFIFCPDDDYLREWEDFALPDDLDLPWDVKEN